jgi:hypothetical protein
VDLAEGFFLYKTQWESYRTQSVFCYRYSLLSWLGLFSVPLADPNY